VENPARGSYEDFLYSVILSLKSLSGNIIFYGGLQRRHLKNIFLRVPHFQQIIETRARSKLTLTPLLGNDEFYQY
jgi:hypothetical protein